MREAMTRVAAKDMMVSKMNLMRRENGTLVAVGDEFSKKEVILCPCECQTYRTTSITHRMLRNHVSSSTSSNLPMAPSFVDPMKHDLRANRLVAS